MSASPAKTLKLALAKGLQDAGVDVLDIGMSGTERNLFRHVPSRRGWRH